MITASLVTYHTKISDLKRIIDCVEKSSICKLYIIDNSKNDNLRQYCVGYDKVEYIKSPNLGFGHSHNKGIRKGLEAHAKYHVIINPDTYWNDPVIEELEIFMDQHSECGLVMPKILYPNGDTQHLCKLLPTPVNLLGRRFIPCTTVQRKLNRRFELRDSGYDKIMEVPALSGCFMFIRTETLKQVGLFDERFFMYTEDFDLCRRIGEVSRTMFYPYVTVYHEYEKGSYKNKKLLRLHILSAIKYFNKWGWFFDSKRRKANHRCLQQLTKFRK